MPQKKKKKDINYTQIEIETKQIQDRYTDSTLQKIVSKHLSTIQMDPYRQKWLWADTLHTSKLLQDIAKQGIFNHIFKKNVTSGQEIKLKVIELGCGDRGASLVMNLEHLFPNKFKYVGIDADGRDIFKSRQEFISTQDISFVQADAMGSSWFLDSLETVLKQQNITHPDLVLFRNPLVLQLGDIFSPYGYFTHLMMSQTPSLFNGATIIITTYLDWERDAASRFLLVNFPYPNKIISRTWTYPNHYNWFVVLGVSLLPRWGNKNLDQFYIGIPQYQYQTSEISLINFLSNNLLPSIPYILSSYLFHFFTYQRFPKFNYFPYHFANLNIFLIHNLIQDMSDYSRIKNSYSQHLMSESIIYSYIFPLTLLLTVSLDLHRINCGGFLWPLMSLSFTFIIYRVYVGYIPSTLSFYTEYQEQKTAIANIQYSPAESNTSSESLENQSMVISNHSRETTQASVHMDSLATSSATHTSQPLWFTIMSFPFRPLKSVLIQTYQFFSHSNLPLNSPSEKLTRTTTTFPKDFAPDPKQPKVIQPPINSLLTLALIPAAKIGNKRSKENKLTDDEICVLKNLKDKLDRLNEERINPALKKIQLFDLVNDEMTYELVEMLNKVQSLLDHSLDRGRGSRFLLTDLQRLMGYLENRLKKVESNLKYLSPYPESVSPAKGLSFFPSPPKTTEIQTYSNNLINDVVIQASSTVNINSSACR